MSEKTRYSDEELLEFKELILQKLEKAQKEYASRGPLTTTLKATTPPTPPPLSKCLKKGLQPIQKRKPASSPSVRKNSSSICRTP